MALRWQRSALARMQTPEQMRFEAAHLDAPVIYRMDWGCDDWYHSADVRVCAFGAADAPHTAVAIGDSIALQWFPAYARVFDEPGWRLLVITKSSCPMVDEPFFYARVDREYTECEKWRHDAVAKIAALGPDVLIMGSASTYTFTQKQWIEGTQRLLALLAGHVRRIYVMRSTPTLPFDGPSCVAPRSWLYRALSGALRCAAPAHTLRTDAVFDWLHIAAAPFPNVHLIDMTDSVCPDDICHAELDGKIVFRDNQHMTASFAESLAPALGEALSKSGAMRTQGPSAATGDSQLRPP